MARSRARGQVLGLEISEGEAAQEPGVLALGLHICHRAEKRLAFGPLTQVGERAKARRRLALRDEMIRARATSRTMLRAGSMAASFWERRAGSIKTPASPT